MTIDHRHNNLSRQTNRWLLDAINPFEKTTLCNSQLKPSEIPSLLKAAELHGVLPFVLKALSSFNIPTQDPFKPETSLEIDQANTAIESARKMQLHQTAFEMLLNHHGNKMRSALSEAGISAIVLKGPVFAQHLYKVPAWRTFTDIDLLISQKDREASHRVFRNQGFGLVHQEYKDKQDYCEDKWLLEENTKVMIELHCNLVHNPRFRQRCSITKEDVQRVGKGNCEEPTALLFVAASHGAIGHQFDRLQHLLDVALAGSGVSGAIDVDLLRDACIKSGVLTAVYTALYLAAKIFPHANLQSLANELKPSLTGRLASQLITPDVVLAARSNARSFMSWRRNAFRQLVQGTGLRPL